MPGNRRGWTVLVVALASLTLLGACAKEATTPAPAPAAEPTPPVTTPAPPPSPGESLLPASDWQVTFEIEEQHLPKPAQVVEEFVRDGRRLVVTYNGTVYLTWHLLDGAVWRLDPKGGGAFLRYLPARLEDDVAWRQTSGDAAVWFHLRRSPAPCSGSGVAGPDTPCWDMTMLNRDEQLLFRFRTGLGPVEVLAENWARPDHSFRKLQIANRPGELPPAARTSFLERGVSEPTAPLPAVETVTPAEFAAAAAAMRAHAGATGAAGTAAGQ